MSEVKTRKKGRILLFLSLLIGAAYLVYSLSYWSSAGSSGLGGAIAFNIVAPHVICEGLAVLFNAIAFFGYNKSFALVAAIMYTVSLVLFPTYMMFVVLEVILCFIAFARMEKKA